MYYNPSAQHARAQEKLVAEVAKSCDECNIPFLFEPINFFQEGESQEQRLELIIKTLDIFSKYSIDIFKIQFPGDMGKLSEDENIKICQDITNRLDVPWIILSAGGDFEEFTKQYKIAITGGAKGFAVGRALWAPYLKDKDRIENCTINEVIEKFNRLSKIAI